MLVVLGKPGGEGISTVRIFPSPTVGEKNVCVIRCNYGLHRNACTLDHFLM